MSKGFDLLTRKEHIKWENLKLMQDQLVLLQKTRSDSERQNVQRSDTTYFIYNLWLHGVMFVYLPTLTTARFYLSHHKLK